jgi:hypothetical protein
MLRNPRAVFSELRTSSVVKQRDKPQTVAMTSFPYPCVVASYSLKLRHVLTAVRSVNDLGIGGRFPAIAKIYCPRSGATWGRQVKLTSQVQLVPFS